MEIYKRILSYLSENDNGEFIDITHLNSDFKFLSNKARELATKGFIKIASSGFYVVGYRAGGKTTYGNKGNLKVLKAMILFAGQEYLKSQNTKSENVPEFSKTKKLEKLNELIYELKTWQNDELDLIENFISKTNKVLSYIDGKSSDAIAKIDLISTKNLLNKVLVADWDTRIINILEMLKVRIEFEELEEHSFDRNNVVYVSQIRIDELKGIQSQNFDLMKLIRLCKELNDAYKLKNYYTVGILVRTIINHVPPIFDKENFASVVSQYKSEGNSTSFKGSMEHLENTSRKIGDSFAHSITRQKENLPTEVQVDFRQGLDVLLGEIVRILK